MSVCLLYFIPRDLKVIRRGAENHSAFSRFGVIFSQNPTRIREEPQLLTSHSSGDLGSHYPDVPKVMELLGLLSSHKKALRFDI